MLGLTPCAARQLWAVVSVSSTTCEDPHGADCRRKTITMGDGASSYTPTTKHPARLALPSRSLILTTGLL